MNRGVGSGAVASVWAATILCASCADCTTVERSGEGGAGGGSSSSHGGGVSFDVAVGPSAMVVSTGSGGGLAVNPDDPYGCVEGPMPSRPGVVPEGFQPYTCWSQERDCILWIASDPEVQTPPIEWTDACSPGSPGGASCRQLRRNWGEGPSSDVGVGPTVRPEIDALTSPPLLRMMRYHSDPDPDRRFAEWTVSELDGPMRWAMRDLDPSTDYRCAYSEEDLNEGVWTFTALGDGEAPLEGSGKHAALVIDIEQETIEITHRADGVMGSWFGGREFLVYTWPGLDGYRRTTDEHFTIHDSSRDPLGGHATLAFHLLGEGAVFEVSHNGLGIRAWDVESGTHELVATADDPTRGAAAPGTDGIDLVWMEGSGRGPDDYVYPVRSIMTAPFTTNPVDLAPRRLRSDVHAHDTGASDESWVVGCGRAARAGADRSDVQIVRLSDGQAWFLPHQEFIWESAAVTGLTCDEIFLTVLTWVDGEPQGITVQRIRLDALGDGVPPD